MSVAPLAARLGGSVRGGTGLAKFRSEQVCNALGKALREQGFFARQNDAPCTDIVKQPPEAARQRPGFITTVISERRPDSRHRALLACGSRSRQAVSALTGIDPVRGTWGRLLC